MQVEQMTLPDLMEQIQIERQLWKTFNSDTQLKLIVQLSDLIRKTINTDITTLEEGNKK